MAASSRWKEKEGLEGFKNGKIRPARNGHKLMPVIRIKNNKVSAKEAKKRGLKDGHGEGKSKSMQPVPAACMHERGLVSSRRRMDGTKRREEEEEGKEPKKPEQRGDPIDYSTTQTCM